jgi:hypothetical protein
MNDILDELKLLTPRQYEILEEMRLIYKAIKEEGKRNRMGDQASIVR